MNTINKEQVLRRQVGNLQRELLHEREKYKRLKDLFTEGLKSPPEHDLDEWESRVNQFFDNEADVWALPADSSNA